MQILRQSTSVVVRVGPAVAIADGITPVTNLTVSGADEAEALRAAGAATLSIAGATFAAVTGADGWYDLTLDTTATNTVGVLDIVINDDSLILPLLARFQVIEEAVYDQFFAAAAVGAPTVAAVSDVKSQLVVVASDLLQVYSDTTRIDSNTVLAETNISDIESSLVIIKSDLVEIRSDTTVIEAGGGALTATQASQLTRVQSDLIIVGSDLVQVYSDTTLLVPAVSDVESSIVVIRSDQVVAEGMLSDIESSLVVVKSDLVVAISDIGDISVAASPDVLVDTTIATLATQVSFTLTAGSADDNAYNGMAAVFVDQSTATQKWVCFIEDYVGSTRTVTLESAPGFTIATGDSIAIMAAGASTSLPPAAELVGAQASQLTRIQSDVIVVDAAVSDVESSLVIVKSDLVVMDNLESDIHSSLVIARSDLLQVYSDTTRIDSNTVLAETNISDIESSLVIIKSDLVVITSDIGDIIVGEGGLTAAQESQLLQAHSDLIVVASDLLQVYSDTSLLVAAVSDVESSLVIVKSDLVVATSDTARIESDAALAEANLSDIESSLVIVKSDLVIITSDTTAVQAKTDQLTFTSANKVDATALRVGTTDLTPAGTGGQGYGAA